MIVVYCFGTIPLKDWKGCRLMLMNNHSSELLIEAVIVIMLAKVTKGYSVCTF